MNRILSIFLLTWSAVILAGCNASEPVHPAPAQTVQARVVESVKQQMAANSRSTGTLHAKQTVILSAQVVGRVQQVLVREV